MNYPDIKLKCQDKDLNFHFLGKFKIERDEKGSPVILKGENYLLSILTELTSSGEPEEITKIPDYLREKLNRRYYDTKKLEDVWRSPGIYAFVLAKKDEAVSSLGCKYIGRAGNMVIERLRGYLVPGPTQSTNKHINNLVYNSLKEDNDVFIYFFLEQDTEKELHRSLKPEWNREK
jgi:hypothetical protein